MSKIARLQNKSLYSQMRKMLSQERSVFEHPFKKITNLENLSKLTKVKKTNKQKQRQNCKEAVG
jgi:hypothetical protein